MNFKDRSVQNRKEREIGDTVSGVAEVQLFKDVTP
jgi:hypothetical protein